VAAGDLVVADGTTTADLTVAVYLNATGLVSGAQIQPQVDAGATGFTAAAAGSQFAASFPADVAADPFVVATGDAEVVISQYVDTDGGTAPKGIEIWNVSSALIDFTARELVVEAYENGNATPATEATINTGALAPGAVLVIGGTDLESYMPPSVRFVDDPFTFNGNDALAVTLGGVTQDVFGTIGQDPGTAWTDGGSPAVSTADQNLALDPDFDFGDLDGWTDPTPRFQTESSASPPALTGFGEPPAGTATTTVQFASATATVNEGDSGTTPLTLNVSIANAPATGSTSADVVVVVPGGTATGGGDDFTLGTASVTFAAGVTAPQPVTLTVNGDLVEENTETIELALQSVTGGATGTPLVGVPGTATVTIVGDDAPLDVLITEIMLDPSDVSDNDGEYIELYNPTSAPIDLKDWRLEDTDIDGITIGIHTTPTSATTIPAYGFFLLCANDTPSSNGGITCDADYPRNAPTNGDPQLQLANSSPDGDEVILIDGTGAERDRVTYDDGTAWPNVSGKAMTFVGAPADNNKDPANWVSAATRQPGFDLLGGVFTGTTNDTGSPGTKGAEQVLPLRLALSVTPGWRMLAAPVDGLTVQTLADEGFVQGLPGAFPGGAPNVYLSYDGAGGATANTEWTAATALTDPLEAAEGFIWYLWNEDLPIDVVVEGTSPSGNVTPGGMAPSGIPTAGLPATQKWHLVGNPYPTAFDLDGLDLDDSDASTSDFDATVQVWDPTGGTYVMSGIEQGTTDDRIAPFQGFFVARTGNGAVGDRQTLTFDADYRTAETTTSYKSAAPAPTASAKASAKTEAGDVARLNLELVGTDADGRVLTFDAAAGVVLHPEATLGRDRWDAGKLNPLVTPSATLAVLGPDIGPDGTSTPDAPLALRSLPAALGAPVDLDLDVRAQGAGAVAALTLRWPSATNWPAGWTTTLTDRVTGQTVDLSAASEYAFAPSAAATGFAEAGPRTPTPYRPPTLAMTRDGASSKSGADAPRFRLRIGPPGTIPVELTGLTATATGEQAVTLTWQTATETNNAGFAVEQREGSGRWREVAFVGGAGTTTEAQTYRHTLANVPYGRHAFRLRQVDFDGTSAPSEAVEVAVELAGTYALAAYPNPVAGGQRATIDVTAREAQAVTVALYDVLGRRVAVLYDGEVAASETERVALPLRGLATGVYLVRAVGERFMATRRLTVVR
jgi:hypothetical protein